MAFPSPSQRKILEERYFCKALNETTWEQLCARVADAVAAAEPPDRRPAIRDEFFRLLEGRIFLPNTPTLFNAGTPGGGSMMACNVRNPEDSMESILDALKWAGLVSKHGGGTGFGLSKLRAKGSPVRSTHGKACGPLAAARTLAAVSQMITQGGKRAGANMGVLDVRHPDVAAFVDCKAREGRWLLDLPATLAGRLEASGELSKDEAAEFVEYCRGAALFQLFNLSVSVDDAFMAAVAALEDWKAGAARDVPPDAPWLEVLPCGKTIEELWTAIVAQATATGDPGILFLDRIQRFARLQSPREIVSTNPCGEMPLPSDGSCNLGSIDLSKFVVPGEDGKPAFAWGNFSYVVATATRFLDDVLETNSFPVPEIDAVSRAERRLGLGVMGWADLLLRLGIPYDSEEALALADKIGAALCLESHRESYVMARERGPFPLFEQVEGLTWSPGDGPAPRCLWDPRRPRRNAITTTVAPTGSISRIAGCFGGIEPHFRAGFEDRAMAESGGLGFAWASDAVAEAVAGHDGSVAEAEEWLRETRGWKPANEIPVAWHVRHQAAWQKWVDASISKTLNLDRGATEADVAEAYLMAFREGCKGVTVYRDGSKARQPLAAVPTPPGAAQRPQTGSPEPARPERRRRPEVVDARTYRIETAEGKMYVTVGFDERRMPFEVFAKLGKAGTTRNADLDAVSKLVSDMFRMNVHPARIVRTLRGIRSMPFGFGEDRVESVPDAIAQVVDRYMTETFGPGWGAAFGWRINDAVPEEEGAAPAPDPRQAALPLEVPARREFVACPDCGAEVVAETGCVRCSVCSWSRC
jgi:ribonucleoside-diphosphate reductase alpha chain